MALKNVLLEIGTEEIPSRFIPDALASLKKNAESSLEANRIAFQEVRVYATPRRLVVTALNVDEMQSAVVELLKGPPFDSAYDSQGNPTRAAIGFAKGKGVPVDALREMEVGGVRYVAAEVKQESRRTIEVLPDLLRGLIEEYVLGQVWRPLCAAYSLDRGPGRRSGDPLHLWRRDQRPDDQRSPFHGAEGH